MIKRKTKQLCLKDPDYIKKQLLRWGQKFDTFVLLDSSGYKGKYSNFDFACATLPISEIKLENERDSFIQLKKYQEEVKDWIFGYLTYDLKNDIERLTSSNYDGLKFPALHFFNPEIIFFLRGNKLEVSYPDSSDEIYIDGILEEVLNTDLEVNFDETRLHIQNRIPKEAYLNSVQKLREHIKRGDIYEVNYCQEFYSENAVIDPVDKYIKLNEISTPPFASFYKLDKHFLVSASPERFIQKHREKVISQPIKGTARRGKNTTEDLQIIEALKNDEKERAENIMIVDLVRNDLSKTSKIGTVEVNELCEIYSFQQVHQMISTVSSEVDDTKSPIDIIKNMFPMGSMTGAPKIRAMQLIDIYEKTKRGLYSGSVGYITPHGDFDFNVIIRSILYNEEKHYLSFTVGGAITYKSDPEKEFEETMIKADAIFRILKHD
ncbi:MAG: anthranilate synthase component I family protein [Flavobacteriales bacterium]|nr:anthranilate synthase component I family protein [Flavobacteriales bacterium]